MGKGVPDVAPRPKGMDAVLQSVFEAGVRAGCGFPVINAVPQDHIDRQLERWKREWQGDPSVYGDSRNEISDRFTPR